MTPVASVDYQKSVTDGLSSVATFVPKLVGFLVILVVGYVIAKIVAKVVNALLERAGFDKAVERGGIKKALDKSSFDASDIVAKVAFYAVFIPFLTAGVGVLGITALEQPLAQFIALLPKIVVAIVLVVIGMAVATAAKKLIEGALGGLSYGTALANGAAVFVALGFVKAALDEVGIATQVTTPLLYMLLATVGGILIVGVGGGLIEPMRTRLDNALNSAADEAKNIKREAQSSNGSEPDGAVYPQGTSKRTSGRVSSTRRS
ncbi:MAG: hypothetical protein JWO12_3400 [Frankiales bacterium]|nr:hypothetical protein [Frankiales bacterium]